MEVPKSLVEKFVGKEMPVEETENEFKIAGKMYKIASHKLTDPAALNELKGEATKMGLSTRIWFPTTIGTMEVRPDRLNVYLRKDDSNVWKIERLTIG